MTAPRMDVLFKTLMVGLVVGLSSLGLRPAFAQDLFLSKVGDNSIGRVNGSTSTTTLNLPGLGDPPIRAILPSNPLPPAQAKKAPLTRDLSRLPLSFESNQGQTDSKVRFLTHSSDSALFLTPTEAVFSMTAHASRQSKERLSLRQDRRPQLIGVGDFTGNGATTLVFQSKTTNQVIYWYTGGTNNATVTGGDYVNVTPATGWKLVGIGDFNGDGKSDLVFQSQTTNQVAIWFMSGPYYLGGVLMPYTPPAGWSVVGVGDFNADGFPDIAFQNQTTGQIALWYMNGPTYAGGTVLTTTPISGWKVVGVGDYNGDGSADLLLQNQTSNQAVVWYLKNGAYAGGAVLSLVPPPGWKIVGPR